MPIPPTLTTKTTRLIAQFILSTILVCLGIWITQTSAGHINIGTDTRIGVGKGGDQANSRIADYAQSNIDELQRQQTQDIGPDKLQAFKTEQQWEEDGRYRTVLQNGFLVSSTFSPIVPGGGLAAHEAAGGHLLLKHVGQSEAQLLQRLANEPRISGNSSFYNLAIAESAISRTLHAKQAEIDRWLRSSKPQIKIEYTLPENVGITIRRGMTKAVHTSSLRLILRRDSSMPNGYRIHTGFPTQ